MVALLKFDDRNPRHRAKAAEWHGRLPGVTAGAAISDLASLQKTVLLCSCCRHKFNPIAHRYMQAMRPPFRNGVWSDCDGCKSRGVLCVMFIPQGHPY